MKKPNEIRTVDLVIIDVALLIGMGITFFLGIASGFMLDAIYRSL